MTTTKRYFFENCMFKWKLLKDTSMRIACLMGNTSCFCEMHILMATTKRNFLRIACLNGSYLMIVFVKCTFKWKLQDVSVKCAF